MSVTLSALTGRLIVGYVILSLVVSSAIELRRLADREHSIGDAAHRNIVLLSRFMQTTFEDQGARVLSQSSMERFDRYRHLIDSSLFVHVCKGKTAPVYSSPFHVENGPLCELTNAPLPFFETIDQGPTPLLLSGTQSGEYRIYVARSIPTFYELLLQSPVEFSMLFIQVLAVLFVGGVLMAVAFYWLTWMYGRSIMATVEQSNKLSPLEVLKPPDVFWSSVYRPIFDVLQRVHVSRNQALSFASYASHELRTPLAVIRNQLEGAMSEELSGAKLRRTISSTYDEVLRLRRSIDDLLSLATMQAGSFQLSRVRVHLNQFLRDFYDEALLLTRPKNISVVLKQGPPASVALDLQRFRQLLFNLLDNALKHTDAGGRIRIGFTVSGDAAILTFSDTGRGISQEALPHVFQPFYRDPQKLNVSGSGLGLALVRWIVELHEGSIAVASDLGHGTTFTLRIPLDDSSRTL